MHLETWDESAAVRYDHTLWTDLTSLRFLDGPHGALLLGAVGVGKRIWRPPSGISPCAAGFPP